MTNTASCNEVAGIDLPSLFALEGLPDGRSVSYVSGSLVAGHGNAWSDVDVYVVGNRRPRATHVDQGYCAVSIHYEFGRRIDFEFWNRRTVYELAERVGAIRFDAPIRDEYFVTAEEAFIHRLRIGVTTDGQVESLNKLREAFDFEKFKAYLVHKAFRHVDHLVEDVCGMLESGHYRLAVDNARRLAGFAVDAYCHHRGNTDPSVKWRLHQLERVSALDDDHTVERRYLDLVFPENLKDAAPDGSRAYAEACLAFVNDIAAIVQG